jgi:hypothetical protein
VGINTHPGASHEVGHYGLYPAGRPGGILVSDGRHKRRTEPRPTHPGDLHPETRLSMTPRRVVAADDLKPKEQQ